MLELQFVNVLFWIIKISGIVGQPKNSKNPK